MSVMRQHSFTSSQLLDIAIKLVLQASKQLLEIVIVVLEQRTAISIRSATTHVGELSILLLTMSTIRRQHVRS